jgi:transposase-like protein
MNYLLRLSPFGTQIRGMTPSSALSSMLNNVVEQDHRRVKSRVAPMLGFKRFINARHVLSGVELIRKIIKGQFGLPESFGTDAFRVWHNVLAA